MAGEWQDFADQAAVRWAELGVDVQESFAAGIRLERLARKHEAMLNDALIPFRRLGIRSMEDFRLLALLARQHPETTSSTAASKVLGLSKAATSSRLDRFVKEGLAERAESQYDKRTIEIHASDDGMEVALAAVTAIAAVHSRLFQTLDPVDLKTFDTNLAELMMRFV